jgi:aminomethyltransferase
LIAAQGPNSADILAQVTDVELDQVRYYAITAGLVAGREVLLARTAYTGEDGFEIFCRPAEAQKIWETLSEAGANHGLVPTGLACRDTLRLEAGMPLYGHELSAESTPHDAGLGKVVKLDKDSDFIGKVALAATAARAAERRLVGLIPIGRRTPRAGYAVLDPRDGSKIGEVTSGAPSPTLGNPIAMAYLKRPSRHRWHPGARRCPGQGRTRGSRQPSVLPPQPLTTIPYSSKESCS